MIGAHYPTPSAKLADLCVHLAGLGLALFGAGIMLGLALGHDSPARTAVVGEIYAAGVLAMLALSTAYNFAGATHRPLLRRFDQAGIFLMIAGSYTPFTTQLLTGAWAIGTTAAVWSVAFAGAAAKLLVVRLPRGVFIGAFLALGWVGVLAVGPLVAHTPLATVVLLAAGGAIYSIGVVFYLAERLRFRRAIWHTHVVAAALVHWLAVLLGVVLAAAPA